MKKKLVLVIVVALVVVSITALCVGCTPGIDAVAKKFELRGYNVTKSDTEVVAGNPDGNLQITVTWFEDGDEAKDFYDKAVALNSEKQVAKKGNAVAVGDEKSISIFK